MAELSGARDLSSLKSLRDMAFPFEQLQSRDIGSLPDQRKP